MNECKRDCSCWTPFGHSAAAKDCHCHEEPLVTLRDPFEMLGGEAA